MAFVLPAPHGNESGGKEVVLCLRKSQAKRLLRPEWQAKLHAYRPVDEAQAPHAMPDGLTGAKGERISATRAPIKPEAKPEEPIIPEGEAAAAKGAAANKPEAPAANGPAEGQTAQETQ
jgi:hypothetical protein